MPTANLRSLIGTPQPKIGTFLFEFATPGIGQILKAAGADYAVLDMEHTGFSLRHRAPGRALLPGGRAAADRARAEPAAPPHLARARHRRRRHHGADRLLGGAGQGRARRRQVLARRHARRGAGPRPTSASRCAPSRCSTASPNRTPAPPSSCRSRTRAAPRPPTRSPPCPASTCCGSATTTSRWRSTSPAPSTIRASQRLNKRRWPRRAKHGKSAGRLAVDARQAASFVKMGYDFVSIAGDVWLLQQAFAAGVETIRRGS